MKKLLFLFNTHQINAVKKPLKSLKLRKLQALLFLFIGATVSSAFAEKTTLLSLNQLVGELWTCSCSMNPIGGVNRIVKFAQSERKENKNLLFLSNGNFIVNPHELPNPLNWEKKSALMAQVLKKLELQAVNFASGDMRLEKEALTKLAKNGNFQWVSTNVVDLKDKPVFPKFIDLSLGGNKYRIFGVTEPANYKEKNYKVLDISKSLASELRSLDPKVIAIVLVDGRQEALGDLSKTAGRDLILVTGQTYEEDLYLNQVSSRTWAIQGGSKGKRIGKLSFEAKEGKVSNTTWSSTMMTDLFEKGSPFATELITLKKELEY